MTDTNSQEGVVDPKPNEGEGNGEAEVVTLSKGEYEKLNQTLGSLKREIKDLKKPKDETPEPKETPQKPNEPDYGKLAFLRAEGIKHGDDIKIVTDEANRLKLPLSDVLEMAHIKAQLKTNKETREAADGMPTGNNRAGNSSKNDVDYWLAKGGLPNDQELAEKVVDARMKRESVGNKFSDSMFNE